MSYSHVHPLPQGADQVFSIHWEKTGAVVDRNKLGSSSKGQNNLYILQPLILLAVLMVVIFLWRQGDGVSILRAHPYAWGLIAQ
jgi:hypothetical protein